MITEKKRKDGAWNCVCATTPKLWIDDVSFSNSLTVEHNTLGGGSIGHILRHTETNSSSYAQSHRWFHYDQVDSIMSESDASGALAQTHYQDAFGNTQASWSTGLWGGDKDGWHHNTKEYDEGIGLVYMFQRWYNPEIGSFSSAAPFAPHFEHPYGFTYQNPVRWLDPRGEMAPMLVGCAGGAAFSLAIEFGKDWLYDKRYDSPCHSAAEKACKAIIGCATGALLGGMGASILSKAVQAASAAARGQVGAAAGAAGGAVAGMVFSDMCKSPCEELADSLCNAKQVIQDNSDEDEKDMEELFPEGQ